MSVHPCYKLTVSIGYVVYSMFMYRRKGRFKIFSISDNLCNVNKWILIIFVHWINRFLKMR